MKKKIVDVDRCEFSTDCLPLVSAGDINSDPVTRLLLRGEPQVSRELSDPRFLSLSSPQKVDKDTLEKEYHLPIDFSLNIRLVFLLLSSAGWRSWFDNQFYSEEKKNMPTNRYELATCYEKKKRDTILFRSVLIILIQTFDSTNNHWITKRKRENGWIRIRIIFHPWNRKLFYI